MQFLHDPRTIVLLSMDFSHHQTSAEADRRDESAKLALEKLDYQMTDGLDIDCHPGLSLLAALDEIGGVHVRILDHSNSAKIEKRLDLPDVTSYYTALFYLKGSVSLSRHRVANSSTMHVTTRSSQ